MVQTRRKSEAAAAAAEHELETASMQGTEDLSLSAFLVPIPPDLDVDTLSRILPDVSFSKPDPETVISVYRLLLAQVADQDDTRRDLEELRAESVHKDIEIDQAIQDGETKIKDLEDALDTLQKEVATMKEERDQLVVLNKDLETRISSFTSSQSSSVSDIDHLRNCVDETDREKRDLIGVVSRLKEDAIQRDGEVQNLRTSLRQAHQDHQTLETQVRELRSTETSTKFKLETLSQQLPLAQSESERINSELTVNSGEYSNYRCTKHTEFIQLQSAHDPLTPKHPLSDSSLRATQAAQNASTQQLTHAKMEAEEREYREALEKEQSETVRQAHEAIQDLATQLERQKKSNEATVQAYMKERDTLKAMLARAERVSLRGGINGDVNGAATTPPSDLVGELEHVQAQFESYKVEMGMDAEKLREDLIQAQRHLCQANAALAKNTARAEFLDERQRMTQEQLSMQRRDLDSLALRNQQLYDHQTRLDIDRERVRGELTDTKSDLEQLRNEAANLRAEKKIWESIQTRLIEENKNLVVERSRLLDLMTNVQRVHNDLERSGENVRRRLESQVQMMDNQMQDLQSQLSQERKTMRHVTLQKDIDVEDLQSRLDKTTKQLSQARESLVGAETSKTHLQERVEDLARQLQSNAKKLAVYERTSTGTGAVAPAPDPDLHARLKVAQVDLTAARNHMQQFQDISQANEAALAALNTTHDEYKAGAEAQLSRHELEYKSLEEKFLSVQQDLQQRTSKFDDLQKTLETERSAWANDKKTLEDTIVDMSTSERHSESDRSVHEREVRALEERAVAAEDRYSREVVTHAESFKTIENLKQQLSNAQQGLSVSSSCPTSDAATVSVKFNVNAHTVVGENIYLTGSVSALKNWGTSNPILLSPANYPIWSTTVNLPANTDIQYKYVRIYHDPVTWESDPNNEFKTGASGAQTLNDQWR